jgi:hypothetical protein
MATRSRTAVLIVLFVVASVGVGMGKPQPAAAVGPTISFCFFWASSNIPYNQSPVFLYYWDTNALGWAPVAQTNGGWSRTDITGCGQFGSLTPGFSYAVRAHYLTADYFVDGWTTSIYAQDGGGPIYMGIFEVTYTRASSGWNQGSLWQPGDEAQRPANP